MEQPENNESLQLSWSRCRTPSIREAAKTRVRQLIADLKARQMEVGRVLVIGPQHGYELEALRDSGVAELVAVDTVPEFVTDCTELGFRCEHILAERMTEVIEGKWNIYASHSLEHCYDLAAVTEQIRHVMDQWCYIATPIEPLGHRPAAKEDKAHLSRFRDRRKILNALVPLQCIRQNTHRTLFDGLFVRSK